MAGQCPTWFKETETGSCECGPELGGVIKCDEDTKKVSIRMGYCMTYDSSSGELLVGYTNFGYMGGRDRAYYILMCMRLTRSVIQRAAEKILTMFHQRPENLTTPLPDRLEHLYAYQSLPDI